MSTVCSSCGGTDIEYDQARGDAVCTSCGSVLEDNIIVSEVSFAEQSSGASSVVGQFVSSESSKVPLIGTGFHHGLGKISREVTLAHAKKRLNNLGHMLRLTQHYIDTAFMFFKMALQLNLTRGRKSSIIDTACLYLVCRSEGTPHLLLDFSDVLQINVYALGRAYMRLSDALHIHPPAIDPCLFIQRFAHKLEFGDKTHDVSMTALRLVARMKRDWIHHGRRPAGLCGAALLVSARIHNFNRSVRQVARIVKLSEGTVRKRLGDFNNTASSRLTIEEFLKIDLEQEHDPPSYLQAKKKARLKGVAEPDLGKEGEEEQFDSEDNLEDEVTWGFGGIRNESVEDIIAKAQYTEQFINSTAYCGLDGSNLVALAKLGDEEDTEATPTTNNSEGILDCTGIDDEEIESLLLSEKEVKIKSRLWFAENGDFLKERELKRERMEAEKAEREKNKKTRKRKPRSHQQQTFATASEAISQMLVEKRISTKINYEVLKDIDVVLGEKTKEEKAREEEAREVVVKEEKTKQKRGLKSKSPPEEEMSLTKSSDIPIKKFRPAGRLPSLGHRRQPISFLSSAMETSGTIKKFRPTSRLPSLTNRKRPLSVLGESGTDKEALEISASVEPSADTTSSLDPESDKFGISVTSGEDEGRTDTVVAGGEATSMLGNNRGGAGVEAEGGGAGLVEESGPVQYYDDDGKEEEEEGVELEDLEYPEDPFNNSDYDDYED